MKKMKGEVKRDRISKMPEEIREQILSSLCMKDAVCTSSLSSVWRYSWVSLPSLDFGYNHFSHNFTSFISVLPVARPPERHHYARQIGNVEYFQMLDEFLQIYIKKNPSLRGLNKISLYVPMLSNSETRDYGAPIVSRCLSLAKHNVTELQYRNDDYRDRYYNPKDSYYALQNCLPFLDFKTLTKLDLRGCCLGTEKNVEVPFDLPNLRQLRLMLFHVNESMLENLIAQCRALEKLYISSGKGFRVLRVPSVSKLKELNVGCLPELDLIEINATEIQCLSLILLKRGECKVKMASDSCNNLVKLYVHHCGVTDDFFNNVAEFPHLETVSLVDCPKLKHIKITSDSLTRLVIKDCPNLSQAEVDVPELFFTENSSSSMNIIKRISPNS